MSMVRGARAAITFAGKLISVSLPFSISHKHIHTVAHLYIHICARTHIRTHANTVKHTHTLSTAPSLLIFSDLFTLQSFLTLIAHYQSHSLT